MTKELLLAVSNHVLLQDYIWKCWRWYLGWTWKQCPLTVSYVIFPFVSSIALFSSRKKWLSCHSHAISPYLHAKLINWTSAFYLSFCCTVLPRILNILIFMNRVISIICICQLYFMLLCSFLSHGICINFDNQQIYYLINPYFFVACVVQPKSVLTRYLGTLLGFQSYKLLDFIL